MSFDLSRNNQGTAWLVDKREGLREGLSELSIKSEWTCLLAAPAAIATAMIMLAEAVTLIGETIIKGLVNIIGAGFTCKCDFMRGMTQLFVTLPIAAIAYPIMIVKHFAEVFFYLRINLSFKKKPNTIYQNCTARSLKF